MRPTVGRASLTLSESFSISRGRNSVRVPSRFRVGLSVRVVLKKKKRTGQRTRGILSRFVILGMFVINHMLSAL